jgi:FKBP-type peptidyl-prolyl cis-trans isomerase FkpA
MSEITAVPLRPIAKSSLTALWIGIGLVVATGVGAAVLGTRSQVAMAQPAEEFLAANAKRDGVKVTPSGLQYQVLKAGSGPNAGPSDMVLLDYEGRLQSGETFDSSARNGGPVPMQVGGVIPGFSEALQLMSKGAKYRFWIPPQLGYGERGAGPIPANAALIFDVDLHEIAPGAAAGRGIPGM